MLPRHLAIGSHPPDKENDIPVVSQINPCAGKSQDSQGVLLDLVNTNPNILQQTHGLLDPGGLKAPLLVGYWCWELEAFPDGWEEAFQDYDEIWCPSSF